MDKKYFKPKSVTWWTGVAMMAGGVVTAVGQEWAPLEPASNVILTLSDIGPAAMFAAGLGLIGLRGKDG